MVVFCGWVCVWWGDFFGHGNAHLVGCVGIGAIWERTGRTWMITLYVIAKERRRVDWPFWGLVLHFGIFD